MTKDERFKRIRQLPCCCGCERPPPSDVAHSNFSEHGKGMGLKANDNYTIPLHRICHAKFDRYGMGLDRQASKAWFLDKLEFINQVLERYGKDETSIF